MNIIDRTRQTATITQTLDGRAPSSAETIPTHGQSGIDRRDNAASNVLHYDKRRTMNFVIANYIVMRDGRVLPLRRRNTP